MSHELLTAEQERAYGLLWQQDRNPEGLKRLVECNQRLVFKAARCFEGFGLDLQDLISEGNLGLIEAAKRFDPNRGLRFTSYSHAWIRGAIQKALTNQGREIRVPSSRTEKMIKLTRTSQRLAQVLGREASPEEIQAETGFTPGMQQQLAETQRTTSTVALDAPIGEDAATIADLIPTVEPNPQEMAASAAIREAVESALGQLDEKQVFVLCHRFGLRDCEELTFEAIGQRMQPAVSREWVRQIEAAAITRIKGALKRRGEA